MARQKRVNPRPNSIEIDGFPSISEFIRYHLTFEGKSREWIVERLVANGVSKEYATFYYITTIRRMMNYRDKLKSLNRLNTADNKGQS
jgi:hypothetical protein